MLINNEFAEQKIQSPLHYMWSTFKRNNIAFTAMWGIFFLITLALFTDLIIPYLTEVDAPKPLFAPPYWLQGGDTINILGTDDQGRDSFSRLLKGMQLTLGGALLITFAISILGLIIGASAALTKGVKASVLHHLLDAFLTIPTLLTALILLVIFGKSYENSLIAVSLSLLPQFIRGIFLSIEAELNKQYIISLRLDGATNLRLLRFGIIPNITEPIVTLLNRIFTMAILEISTLGFLGFSSQRLDAELGSLIAQGTESVGPSFWLILLPGLAIFMIILIFNIFAEGLRHAIIEVEDE